jgi:hypothetical protein
VNATKRRWSARCATLDQQQAISVNAVIMVILLGVLCVASSLILWRLGDTGDDQISKSAYIRDHKERAAE